MTDSCNLHCPFCYVKQKPTNLDANKAIGFIKKHRPHNIIFHGGEPLMRAADILKIMDAVPETPDFSVTSNLMLPLTEDRLEVIKRCGVATSYSVDRFESKEQLEHFKTAVDEARKYGEVTLLVTLSKPQLEQPPEELCKTLEWLDVDYITLERLRDDSIESPDEYRELYLKTDEYLYEIFSKELIPNSKNSLLFQMKEAIETNTPLFSICCQEETRTLLTDGESTTFCPNGDPVKEKRLRECLSCDLSQFCKGDCPSFCRLSCSFPKKTFNYVRGGLANGL
jgi:MoaA/NifB/PqqE/SkfB family radical SAM enzyme